MNGLYSSSHPLKSAEQRRAPLLTSTSAYSGLFKITCKWPLGAHRVHFLLDSDDWLRSEFEKWDCQKCDEEISERRETEQVRWRERETCWWVKLSCQPFRCSSEERQRAESRTSPLLMSLAQIENERARELVCDISGVVIALGQTANVLLLLFVSSSLCSSELFNARGSLALSPSHILPFFFSFLLGFCYSFCILFREHFMRCCAPSFHQLMLNSDAVRMFANKI